MKIFYTLFVVAPCLVSFNHERNEAPAVFSLKLFTDLIYISSDGR